jgi:Tol biopolymer transport system component
MGVVYKAEDKKLNRTVALKFLSSQILNSAEAKTRFIAEARAASALDHPNICSVYEIDEADGHMFIAMQYVDGEGLNEKIARGPLKYQEILDLGMSIAQGLQEAHEKNIVHRDIKSANVMITGKGQGKITDFGLAKLVGDTRVTKTGTMLGTAAYMSPEQLTGEDVDHRSDIWSLGVILYEMTTGRLPFAGDYEQATAYQIMNEEAEPVTAIRTGVPMDLERIVNKCLEKDTSNRYQHVDDLLVDFRNIDREPVAKAAPKARFNFTIPLLAVLAAVVALSIWGPFDLAGDGGRFGNPLAGAMFTKVTNIDGFDAAISPDGKFIVFVSDYDGQFDLWVSQVGTGNVYNRTRGQAGDVRRGLHAVSVSVNSSEIVLAGSYKDRLQIMPLLSGPLRNLLTEGVIQADWSPDGGRLVYFTATPGDPLYVADSDGTNSSMILDSELGMHQHYPTWSLDGEWIYFVRGRENVWDTDLWRVRPDGRDAERLTANHRNVTSPTPIDERTVLFVARSEDGSGPWLWSLDLETKASQRASIGLEKYRSLSASQDGRRLAATIVHPEAHLWSVPILDRVASEDDAAPYELPAVNAQAPRFGPETLFFLSSTGSGNGLWKYENGRIEEVWNGARSALFEAPAVSPDGESVAVVLRRDGKHRLYVMSADGSNLRELAESVDARGAASWSPDGKWIVVGGEDALGPGLFRIPADGGDSERIADGEALSPVWSPTRDLIIYAGEQVGPFSPLMAIKSDGTRIDFPEIKVRSASERCRFLPDGSGLVYMTGTVAPRQEFWLLDLATMDSRRLSELAPDATTESFDVSPNGRLIVFDRMSDNSEIVLIELADGESSE